jgi:hypothetical protein
MSLSGSFVFFETGGFESCQEHKKNRWFCMKISQNAQEHNVLPKVSRASLKIRDALFDSNQYGVAKVLQPGWAGRKGSQ